mgnify:CR=1 FL=1
MSRLILGGLILFGFLACLAGCSSPQPADISDMEIIHVQCSASLEWMGEAMNQCALSNGVQLLVNHVTSGEMDLSEADILIGWGVPDEVGDFPVIIGEDELIMVVHPDNPINELTMAQVQDIFSGSARSWQAIFDQCPECSQIDTSDYANLQVNIWIPPLFDETRLLWDKVVMHGTNYLATAKLAADASQLQELIADDKSAIGFLPGHWSDRPVKTIRISDLESNLLQQPILAISSVRLKDRAEHWLSCLQNEIGK